VNLGFFSDFCPPFPPCFKISGFDLASGVGFDPSRARHNNICHDADPDMLVALKIGSLWRET